MAALSPEVPQFYLPGKGAALDYFPRLLGAADVLYEKTPYPLPLTLSIGDEVFIENTGAYTTTYASVAFNGFEPLRSYVI